MSVVPHTGKLKEAVAAILTTYPELKDNVEKVAQNIKDDHFMWKVDVEQVKLLVEQLTAEAKPVIVKPEDLYEMKFNNLLPLNVDKASKELIINEKLEIEGIHHSQGGLGSLGVFFVFLKDKRVFVMKQKTQNFFNEFFATVFLAKNDVNVPKMRMLNKRELTTLEELLRPVPVTSKYTCMEIHEDRFLEAGAFVMNFVKGGQELDKSLGKSLNAKLLNQLFATVGKIVAVDTAINMTDRSPFLRRGDGNPGNILVVPNSAKNATDLSIFAIDNLATVQESEDIFKSYKKRIEALNDDEVLEKELDSVLNFLGTNLGIEVNEELKASLINGFKKSRANLKENGPKLIAQTLKEIRKVKKKFDDDKKLEIFITAVLKCF